MPESQHPPVVKVEVLVRRPAAAVFAAITRPELLTKYWLSRASGPLEPGKRVHWEFMVEGATADCLVREFEQDSRLLIEWSDGTTVDWKLTPRADGTTLLAVEHAGFHGAPDAVIATALGATEGFTIVLCGLKALLEHNDSLNLVRDKALLIQESLHQEQRKDS